MNGRSGAVPGAAAARRLRAVAEYYLLSAPLLVANLTYRQYRTGASAPSSTAAQTALPQLR